MIGRHPPDLLDRVPERSALDQFVTSVRSGLGQALVLRGEAGAGKTALLRQVPHAAEGCEVVWTTGVESEMELAFSGLHSLFASKLGNLSLLPEPQREALGTAFGLHAGPPPDRFLVGLAILSLLAETAAERPLVCIVDDFQWLDRVSSETLAFVARRFLAEPVGFVFAVRGADVHPVLEGLPEMVIEGLPADYARVLLDSMIPGPLDEDVKARILDETRGNPLALMELPRGLTPAQLAGGFGLADARPLTSSIEQSYLQRIEALPPDAQLLLLTAASEPLGDVNLLWRAAGRLGIDRDAVRPAEAAGLIELGVRVRFPHPLVRAAVHQAFDPSARRDVRRALADATDPDLDPDRRAWHNAHSTAVPDEGIAAEMVRSADRAQARGGLAAAAAFLQRAAELTPDPGLRVERLLAAAQAKLGVADTAAASNLLAAAEFGPLDALGRARLERLRADVVFLSERGRDAPQLLLDAARRLEPVDAASARDTYLEGISSAMFAGRLGTGPRERDLAEAASGISATAGSDVADLLLAGLVVRYTDGYAASVAPLSQALRALRGLDGGGDDDQRWLWMGCRLAQEIWDDELWFALASRGVRVARDTGALTLLPVSLNHLASFNVHSGAFAAAATLIDELGVIARAVGFPSLDYSRYKLAATRGDQAAVKQLDDGSLREAETHGEGQAIAMQCALLALMHNSHSQHDKALAAAQEGCADEEVMAYNWSLVERVEAAVRCGQAEDAAATLDRLAERTTASGTAWALGVEARSRALLHGDEAAFQESIEQLTRSRAVVDLARSRLVYGEWLRRENRRVDAREQLRVAHESFSHMGSDAFAERAGRELAATGEHVRRITPGTWDTLTPQELHVARLARDGHTNPEIGARLYISRRTVEYHLAKVFRKLDITSRRALRDALDDASHQGVQGYL